MKTNSLIVIGMIIAIIISVSALIIIDHIESQFEYPPPCAGCESIEIQKILDYCEAKERILREEGKNLRLTGGDIVYANYTHRIDTTICE